MMQRVVFILLVVFCVSCELALYTRTGAATGWVTEGPATPFETKKVHIALVQQNLALLSSIYDDLTNPDSENYAQWLEREEILSLIAPPKEKHDAVYNWASSFDNVYLTSFQDSIRVEAPVNTIEQMFQVKLYEMRHLLTDRKIVRAIGTVMIPDSLIDSIVMITGLIDYPAPRYDLKPSANKARVIPETLRSVYAVPPNYNITTNSSQCVVEFQDDTSFKKTDLSEFYQECAVPPQLYPKIVGPYNGRNPDIEATLDIEYISGVGQGGINWYWTERDWMYEFAVKFFNSKEVPLIASMSWGWSEDAQCDIDTKYCTNNGIDSQQYVERVNTEFQKIGLRGVTLLAASGDAGANGRSDESCERRMLLPDFPAASPFVVSVGATQFDNETIARSKTFAPVCRTLLHGCAVGGTEEAVSYNVSFFTSGGGFSNVATQPSWQTNAVNDYLSSGVKLPPASYFNTSGRAYPDIAALGDSFLIRIDGSNSPVGGTSCSSPTVGGLIAILNDFNFQAGRSSLGPANPLLYKMGAECPDCYHDITLGSNICTEDGCSPLCKGYRCAKGWDPVSGWGTPNVTAMMNFISGLSPQNK